MGCQMGSTCVVYGDQCPYNCPPVPVNDCSAQGMQNCPGPMDPMGCMTADTCVPLEEMCPLYCPYVPPMDLLTPMSLMVISAPTTALLFPLMTAQHKGCRTALDQWT